MEEMVKKMDEALKHLGIPYVLIGGIAASVVGKPRMTTDADVIVLVSTRKLGSLLGVLKSYGFRIPSDRRKKVMKKLQDLLPAKIPFTEGFSVDIRLASYTLDRNAIRRSNKIELFGKMLPIASPEDVILYKVVRFNELDRGDIKAILSRSGKKLDISYINRQAQELSRETGYTHIAANLKSALQMRKSRR